MQRLDVAEVAQLGRDNAMAAISQPAKLEDVKLEDVKLEDMRGEDVGLADVKPEDIKAEDTKLEQEDSKTAKGSAGTVISLCNNCVGSHQSCPYANLSLLRSAIAVKMQ